VAAQKQRLLPKTRASAIRLAEAHPRLKALIDTVGPSKLYYDPESSVFQALTSAITHQQLHGSAARTIFARFVALFPPPFPEPRAVAEAELDSLLGVGLSRSKANAIKDLAAKILDGTVPGREAARRMSNEELVDQITKVKGIGRWTVEIFLIFNLGRPDIFPVHDFGVRKGWALLFRKRRLPTPEELEKQSAKFSPHRSTLAWYLWRAADLAV
jgi:DNA-3-methyladenine glycosylase II